MIPEIFKKWFSKRDKDCSPDSEPESEEKKHLIHNMKAYIVLGADRDGDNFVAVQFEEDQHHKMAELLFLLVSGTMMDETIQSLRRACDNEHEVKLIMSLLSQMTKEHAQQQQLAAKKGKAVVDPTEVFNRGEKNDYKG